MVLTRSSPTPTMQATGPPPERRRPKIAAMETGPGPAQYCLPGTCGSKDHDPSRRQTPAYSFGKRTKQFSSMHVAKNSPGPVYYVEPTMTRTGKGGSPNYSIYGRPKATDKERSPGPAAYPASSPPSRGSTPPAYSMGKRLVFVGSRSSTPAPNKYTLPALLGSNVVGKKSLPAYSLASRPKTGGFDEDLRKTPGPGTYPVVRSCATPSFSMTGRNFPPSGQRLKPGPAEYGAEKVVVSHRAAPSYSFGVKHSEYIASYLEMVV